MESTGKAVIAEFIATFTLIFISAATVILYLNGQLDLTGVALAQGLALAIMVSVTAHISGGMVNPAVAVALWTTGKLPSGRAAALIVAQCAGAVAAASLLKALEPHEWWTSGSGGIPAVLPTYSVGKAILIEAIASFFLIFAVFGTSVDDRGPFRMTAGFTIGLVVAFDVMAFFPLTGAAMNPARWLGPAVATGDYTNWYVWVVGPIAGGIIAGVVYWYAFLRGKEPATP